MEIITNCDESYDKLDQVEATFLPRLTEEVRLTLFNTHNFLIPLDCTRFIVRCLRIKDYNVDKAAKLIKTFAQIQKIHGLVDKLQPRLYKDLYPTGVFAVLNSRDEFGRQVILAMVRKWDPRVYDFDQLVSAFMVLFSFTVGESPETQRKGVVFIMDMSELGFRHVKGVRPGRMLQLAGPMQDGSPGRIKGVHMVFNHRIVGIIYQLVKPLVKDKLAKRIHFHGNDLTSLHEYVGDKILPASLGGVIKVEEDAVDKVLMEKLVMSESMHKNLKEHGVLTY